MNQFIIPIADCMHNYREDFCIYLSPNGTLHASVSTSITRCVLYFFPATLNSQEEGRKDGTQDKKSHDMPGVLYLVLC